MVLALHTIVIDKNKKLLPRRSSNLRNSNVSQRHESLIIGLAPV